ncbi:MAG: tetratricopeptide repeat protein, partial [Paraprevotella sp.]|nr:tetratricopeptide repeat protein [Paraprevotella sp.]
IIVVVAGFFLYRNFVSKPREAKANELIFKGQQNFASDNYEQALNGDGQGFPGFLKIANDYGSTKAGNLAQLYAGLSYAKMGKYKEAVTKLEKFSSCGDEMVSPAALGALGNCYAELNQLDKATSTLLEAAKKADNNSLSPVYLIQAGEIFESQGKKDKALECYQQIKSKYVNSMQYSDIDKYIERASK